MKDGADTLMIDDVGGTDTVLTAAPHRRPRVELSARSYTTSGTLVCARVCARVSEWHTLTPFYYEHSVDLTCPLMSS